MFITLKTVIKSSLFFYPMLNPVSGTAVFNTYFYNIKINKYFVNLIEMNTWEATVGFHGILSVLSEAILPLSPYCHLLPISILTTHCGITTGNPHRVNNYSSFS
jgi:hypothetical protein